MFIAMSWSLAEADISCFIRQAQFGKVNLNTVARQAVTGRTPVGELIEELVDRSAGMKTGEERGSSPVSETPCD